MSKTPFLDQIARQHGIALSKEEADVDDVLRKAAQGHALEPVPLLGMKLAGDRRRHLALALLRAHEAADRLIKKS